MKEFLKAFSSAGASDAYKYLGSFSEKGKTVFRVWAPNAAAVSVVGSFNEWDESADPMNKKDGGIWEKKIPALDNYASYKYAITGTDGVTVLKSDPYARHFETAPANASKLYFSDYKWRDDEWRENRISMNLRLIFMSFMQAHGGALRTATPTIMSHWRASFQNILKK